jgi:hypothetical protein
VGYVTCPAGGLLVKTPTMAGNKILRPYWAYTWHTLLTMGVAHRYNISPRRGGAAFMIQLFVTRHTTRDCAKASLRIGKNTNGGNGGNLQHE